MSKKAFAVFEIDCVIGVDEHSLTSLKPAAYKFYVIAWAWCWKYSRDAIIDAKLQRKLQAFSQMDARTVTRALQECCKHAVMLEHHGSYKLLGLLEKRAEYFKKRKAKVGDLSGNNRGQVDVDIDKDKEVEESILPDHFEELKKDKLDEAMLRIEKELAEEHRRQEELWGN